MKLSECPVRTRLRLTRVEVPGRHQLRIRELGLRPGNEAFIVQHGGFGGLVLNIAGSRVAIDHCSAKLMEAEVLQ